MAERRDGSLVVKKLKTRINILMLLLLTSLTFHIILELAGQAQRVALQQQLERQAAQIQDKQEQIKVLEIIIENQKQDASETVEEPEYIGTFTVTHYCPCIKCCGKTDGITFTGTQATEGKTIAVDPEVIPLGSTVIIDGQEYIAEDVGGAIKGNRIDRFMDSHQAALNEGVVQAEVYIGG